MQPRADNRITPMPIFLIQQHSLLCDIAYVVDFLVKKGS